MLPLRETGVRYKGFLWIISYKCMWTYNYLKVKKQKINLQLKQQQPTIAPEDGWLLVLVHQLF